MSRHYHLGLSVRGALRWDRREMKRNMKWMSQDGRPFRSVDELHTALMDLLRDGKEVIPYGEPCDNWDYKSGCQGHEQTEAIEL